LLRKRQAILVDTAPHGGVSLGIQVYQKNSPLGGGQRGPQIDTGSGFAYAAFLISDRDDFCHTLEANCAVGAAGRGDAAG
jgi:hypothetical protein